MPAESAPTTGTNFPVSSCASRAVHATGSARDRRYLGNSAARERSHESAKHRGEEAEPVGAGTAEVLDGVLGVRHQPHHVAALVGDPGDATERAVGVVAEVAGDHSALALEPVEGRLVGDEAALAVLQHDRHLRTLLIRRGPHGGGVLDPESLVEAAELAVVVADQRAGQQVRLAEDLEAVADAE